MFPYSEKNKNKKKKREKKKKRLFFPGHCFSEFLQTLLCYNFALGLPIHTRFDYVGLVSRSQVCQKHKLPFKKKKLPSVV